MVRISFLASVEQDIAYHAFTFFTLFFLFTTSGFEPPPEVNKGGHYPLRFSL